MIEEKETRDFESRAESLRVTYHTNNPENAHTKESAILYCMFKYYVNGGRTDTLYYKAIFRHKSKIVFREEYRDVDFEMAKIEFFRTVRRRSYEWHPMAVAAITLEKALGPLEA